MEQEKIDDFIEKETLINRYGIVEEKDIVDICDLEERDELIICQ